jgi:hypothetical protein
MRHLGRRQAGRMTGYYVEQLGEQTRRSVGE